VIVTKLTFGRVSIKVVKPEDPDQLLDDPVVHDWNKQDDYMPYWAYLWPGARLLAEVVAREPWPSCQPGSCSPRLLEIGCGLGVAGLVALARGCWVEFTDYDPAPLDFVARSVMENGFDPARVTTHLLDWREPPDRTYPYIIGSDVLYERRLVPLVAGLLARMLSSGGEGLIACPGRTSAERFPDALAALGLSCRVKPVETHSEDHQRARGFLYRVCRPA
jgi:predicted nicotinamide N-methyase